MEWYSTDNVLIVKDNRKEENYQSIITKWEEVTPGRAQTAKTSRRKYLVFKKNQRGEELDEEE